MTAGPIGIVCNADHHVFSTVAERLRARGHAVRFFEPGTEIPRDDVDGLAALVNKKVRRASFRALHYADRTGVPTWNGFFVTTALSCRLVALHALEAVGCRTPRVYDAPPDGEYVTKSRYAWEGEPELGGTGDVYQELVRTTRVDDKYYAVRTPDGVEVVVVRARSKLYGEKEVLGLADPDPGPADSVRRLVERTGAGTLGVDFVEAEDGHYAVDVNPCPSFRTAGLERAITDSIDDLTTTPS